MCSLTTAPKTFKENKMKTIITTIGLVLLLTTTAGSGYALELCAKADRVDPSQAREKSKIKLRAECRMGTEVSIGTTDDLAAVVENTAAHTANSAAIDGKAEWEAVDANTLAIATQLDLLASSRIEVVGPGPGLTATATCPEGTTMTGAACTSGSAVTGMSSVSDNSVSCIDGNGSSTAVASAFCLASATECQLEGRYTGGGESYHWNVAPEGADIYRVVMFDDLSGPFMDFTVARAGSILAGSFSGTVIGDCQSIIWNFGAGVSFETVRVSGSYCGDGILDLDIDEVCDDGNLEHGDGCDLMNGVGICQPTP
jgi:cysteine-rich repeat protein